MVSLEVLGRVSEKEGLEGDGRTLCDRVVSLDMGSVSDFGRVTTRKSDCDLSLVGT